MVLQLQLQLQLHRPSHYLHPHTRCYSNPNSLGFPKPTSFNFPSLKIPTKTPRHYHKHKTPSILPVTVANKELPNLPTSDPTPPTGIPVYTFLTGAVLEKVYDTLVKGKKLYDSLLLIVRIILDVLLFIVIGQRTQVPEGGNLLKTLKGLAWVWRDITRKNEEETQNLQTTPKIDPTLVSTFLTCAVLQKVYKGLVNGKRLYDALLLIVRFILDVWLFIVIGQRAQVPEGGNLLKTLKGLAWVWRDITRKNEEEKKKAEEEGGSKEKSGENEPDEEEEKKKN